MKTATYCRLSASLLFFSVALLVIAACSRSSRQIQVAESTARSFGAPPPESDHFFLDISDYSGIEFIHTFGDDELSNIVESVGGGAAMLDYDLDGYLDIYIINGSYSEEFSNGNRPANPPRNALYKNLGDNRFIDVTDQADVGDTSFGLGVAVGDYDNDGFPDIYVTNYKENVLYRNNGDGTFEDVTRTAGVGGGATFSVGAVWLDYDNDGLLDLYVGNYVRFDPDYDLFYTPDGFPGPLNFDGQPDVLYRNQGNGRFEDVTESTGVFRSDGRAMGVSSADYNNDGYPDIYVANDQMGNYLFRNDGGSGFTEVAVGSGTAFNHTGEATSSMAVDFGDYDGNGLPDLFVSDESYSALYTNLGNGGFADLSYQAGIAIPSGQHIGWASAFFDYNNNMTLDIFKVNGEIQHLHGQEDQLFENREDGRFDEVSVNLGPYFMEERVGRGACFGDLDNDGDLDLFIVNLDDRPVLLRNEKGNTKNWILIKLVGTASNRDGTGAKLTVQTGNRIQVVEKRNAGGYLSQNDPRVHVGLGNNERVERIEIAWPSGKRQVVENVTANQILTITEE